MIGVSGRPRSPEKTIVRSGSPSRSRDADPDDRRAEDVAGVDERRVDPRRDLDLLVVVDRLELLERLARLLLRVERLVEVDLDVRRLARGGPPRGRRRWRPAPAGRRADDGAGPVRTRSPRHPRRRSRSRRQPLPMRPPTATVAGVRRDGRRRVGGGPRPAGARPRTPRAPSASSRDGLVGMLPLPARLALRELLLELAGVEQDELGQLAGRRASR